MRKYHFILFLFVSIIACNEKQTGFEATADYMEEMQDIPRTAEPPAPPSEESDADQSIRNSIEKGSKIIKDGNVRVEVDDLRKAKTRIDSTLIQFDAYYENEGYQSGTYRSSYQLRIRVPSDNFEKLLSSIEMGAGKILQKNISARDVTEEYVDVAIRLNNSKNYLNRYQELLKKANSIKDILEIQEKTRHIEEEIDARTGRLKFIDDQVKFSTLHLELFQEHENVTVRKARNFGQQLVNAFKDGVDVFLDFLLFLVNIWPFILLFGLLWAFRKRIRWRFWRKAN